MSTIINAEGMVLGRMATKVAKMLLEGDKVEIVNAEKAVISGSTEYVFQRFNTRFMRTAKGNPRKGPHHSRMPDRIVRAAVRNMLPKYSTRGRASWSNLKVWIGIPAPLKNEKTIELPEAKKDAFKKSTTVGEVAKLCGATF